MRRDRRVGCGQRQPKGFTAIELIIVILVLGVLTASIMIKNPFTVSDYSSIAADQLIADIQYVQMKAMGAGSARAISFAPGSREYTIQEEAETRKLPQDNSGNPVVTTTNFGGYGHRLFFNSLGEPCLSTTSPPSSCTGCPSGTGCTVSIGTSSLAHRVITIYPETGEVR
jgi:prepilin-type N-terminal cleavage/methylation domain-containing protein